MGDRGDVYVGDGPGQNSWGCVGCGIKYTVCIAEGRVKGTVNVVTPGFGITTVAATARLLCDEEADVVVPVRACAEAATAQHTAFVESAVPERRE